jgi:hypothetical protein
MDWQALAGRALAQNLRVFGTDVVYDRVGSSAQPVRGIFAHPAQEVVFELAVDPLTIASRRPTLFVRLADLPDGKAEPGDTITGLVAGVTHRVVRPIQPDDHGGALLPLEVAP